MEALLIFPHQLFASNLSLAKGKQVYLIEEPLLFIQFKFHKQKLILHRASMKQHQEYLQKNHIQTHYIEFHHELNLHGIKKIHYIDVVDDWLEKKIQKLNIPLEKHETEMFLTPLGFIHEHFNAKNKVLMAEFYISQRKRLNILIQNNKPVGGKWSFDTENRKKLPKNIAIPVIYHPPTNPFVTDAIQYVQHHFSDNYGVSQNFSYPTNYTEAKKSLHDFLHHRFIHFGDYEDAIAKDHNYLFHSVLTPALNIGLLTPREVINDTLEYAKENNIAINQLEGFIRQIIGWREYMRAVYITKGRASRTRNFWKHHRAIPRAFWTGTTAITPVDNTIQKLLSTAYSHHIERLMVLGNFMLLCELDPDAIYSWFMELYIDAYDWVMVPNVYNMSQYADGGMITTKPYISSSNYILKMSDYKRGEWCEIWDALYWSFIHKHQDFFSHNPRLSVMTLQLNRMTKEKLNSHLHNSQAFLKALS